MKRLWCLTVSLLMLARIASAQPIHQYPYDPTVTAYGGAIVPPLLSGQCHWWRSNPSPDDTNAPRLIGPALGHTHFERWSKIYAEQDGGPITERFRIMLFQTAGHIDRAFGIQGQPGSGVSPDLVIWDDTGTTAPPEMQGDPNGLVMWTGTMTYHVTGRHGWVTTFFMVQTDLDDGNRTRTGLGVPFYSVSDLSMPEEPLSPFGINHRSECNIFADASDPNGFGGWGQGIVEYKTYLPILSPLTDAVPDAIPDAYQYAATPNVIPRGRQETHLDMDLHHGVAGTTLQSVPENLLALRSPFDPANFSSPGVHKVAALGEWDSTPAGTALVTANEQQSALLVVEVTIGSGGPPPPPIQTWMTIASVGSLTVQQLMDSVQGMLQQFRLCDGAVCSSQIQ